jgi:hypothetical protein
VVMGRRAPELEAALTILGRNATAAVRGDVTVAADLQRLHDVAAATGKGLERRYPSLGDISNRSGTRANPFGTFRHVTALSPAAARA